MSYTIKEIIDIAIGMENAGYTFYTKISEKFEDQKIKDLFSFLAKQELDHKKKFENLLSDIDSVEGDFNEEYYLYLKAIGGGKVYPGNTDFDEEISKITTPVEALQKGFSDEKEAILFYGEIKKIYKTNDEITKIIDAIIDEERKHALALWDLKEKLLKL